VQHRHRAFSLDRIVARPDGVLSRYLLGIGNDVAQRLPRNGFGIEVDEIAETFGLLGDPTRVRILDALSGEARVVSRFREKPDLAAATSFLEAGPSRFLWNSGMFVWRASTLLAAVDAFEPETGRLVREVVAGRTSAWDELAKKSIEKAGGS